MSQEAIKPSVPAAPQENVAPQEQKPQTDPRMAQLAQRERALRAQQRQLQQQMSAFKQEQEKSKNTPPDISWKDRLKQDFIGTLTEAGMDYNEAAKAFMNSGQETMEIRALKREIAELKGQFPKVLEEVKATNSKAYDNALKQVARDVKVTTSGNEAFEIINSKGSVGQEAVVEYIKTTYEEDGILLSAEEAAKEVEDYLFEEAQTLLKLKKVQAKLAEQAAAKNPDPKTQQIPKTQTLTNQATTSTVSKKFSANERRERAILAAQGLLKQ